MALPTSSLRKRVRLFPLLEGNTDLSRLQRTMKVIKASAKLLDLSQPKTALAIPPTNSNFAPTVQAKKRKDEPISDETADRCYRIIAERVYTTPIKELNRFQNLKSLMRFLRGDYIRDDVLHRLVYGSIPEHLQMYRLEYSMKFARLSVSYKNLDRFPTTKKYLERVVWAPGRLHKWLPPKERVTPETGVRKDASRTKVALSTAQHKQADALFSQLLQLAITHGNPLPPSRLTGAVSDIQQQADMALRKVNELCRQYPDTVQPLITLQRPSDRPSYVDVVLQVKHEDDLSFLPMTAKLLASPHLTIKRV